MPFRHGKLALTAVQLNAADNFRWDWDIGAIYEGIS